MKKQEITGLLHGRQDFWGMPSRLDIRPLGVGLSNPDIYGLSVAVDYDFKAETGQRIKVTGTTFSNRDKK